MLAGVLVLGFHPALAQDAVPDIKPGLWEMRLQGGMAAQMEQAMQQMDAQMAQMSPEQRQQMQAMMGNMGMNLNGNGGVRICMTREDIQKSDIPMNDGDCTTTITERSASRWASTAVCTNPEMTVASEAVFSSPVAYAVKMKGMRTENGRQQPFEMAMDMKHISTDCGEVTPRSRLVSP